MTKEKLVQYSKAYVQLYEIIKLLPEEDKNKIPSVIIENIIENKDNNYRFYFDTSKTLLEQDLMVETKALLVQLYAKYLVPENEKEKWEKYNQICINKIESEKLKKYNPENVFIKKEQMPKENISKEWVMVEYKESIFKRFINKIKRIFRKNKDFF